MNVVLLLMLSIFIQQIKVGDIIQLFFNDNSTLTGKIEDISEKFVQIKTSRGKTTLTESEFIRNVRRWDIIETDIKSTDRSFEESTSEFERKEEKKSDAKEIAIKTFLENFTDEILKTKLILSDPIYSSPFPRGTENLQNLNWNKINNQFQHAKKNNQKILIPNIIKNLDSLADDYPKISSIPYNAGCFSFFIGNLDDAIQYFEKAFFIENDQKSLNNLIVSLIEKQEYSRAFDQLSKIFSVSFPWEKNDEWNILINLTLQTNNFKKFQDIFQKIITRISSKKIQLNDKQASRLFKTIIFLLNENQQQSEALSIIDVFNENVETISKTLNLVEIKFTIHTDKKFSVFSDFATKGKPQSDHPLITTDKVEAPHSDESDKALPLTGRIYSYKQDRNYGFIRDSDDVEYFFHRSAIIDNDILNQLSNLGWNEEVNVDVFFEKTFGPRGPIAIEITSPKTIDELLKKANDFADFGDYLNAINHIKQLISLDPQNLKAHELLEKWKKYSQISNLPKGNNPYAKAVRAQIAMNDFQKAELLFLEAIQEKDNFDNAIIDLATIYTEEKRFEDAIQLLKNNLRKVKNLRSVENLLITIYKRTEQYESLISLLEHQSQKVQNNIEKGQILLQIGNAFLHLNKFEESEKAFQRALETLPDNLSARRNIAICLFKQNKLNDAEAILNKILEKNYDASALDLKNAIADARKTGQSSQFEEIATEAASSEFSNEEITEFTQFFLSKFDISTILPNRIIQDEQGNKQYTPTEKEALNDIQFIERKIRSIKVTNPKEIANHLFAAALICNRAVEDRSRFYYYLNLAFSYYGDNAVLEYRPLDSIKSWYCESLIAFGNTRSTEITEPTALSALSKFLYASLGRKHIHLSNLLPLNIIFDEIFQKTPNKDMIFEAIGYLVYNSQFASNKIFHQLHNKPVLKEYSIEYLKKKGIIVSSFPEDFDEFVNLWNQYRRKSLENDRHIKSEFYFFKQTPFNPVWLESLSNKIPDLIEKVLFKEDKDRLLDLKNIVDSFTILLREKSFEENEHLLIQIGNNCKILINEIEESPTQLSINGVLPLVMMIKTKAEDNLNTLYQTSTAELLLRSAIPLYYHDNNEIEIQLVIENKISCSPADNIELIPVGYDGDLFEINTKDLKISGFLRGGKQAIIKIPLSLHKKALSDRSFSFSVYGQYQCHSGETKRTIVNDFKISVFPETEFKTIDNPYSQYAEGTIVKNPEMFFGRDELIQNIFTSIQNSRNQSKCIIIFGQKRSGKSSILYHLKIRLKKDPSLIVLDLGSLGSIMDNPSIFHYNLLWSILRALRDAINEIEESYKLSKLNIEFPTDKDFFSHPSPQVKFMEIFDNIINLKAKNQDWCDKRIVLLIDEFSYIYGEIVTGKIPPTFMKLWKALIEKNYFGAVLVGQDVMEKFKREFPNEFGAIQDERVSYLKKADAIELIDEPIRIKGSPSQSRYKERAIDEILELTAGNPFFIQIICNRLVQYMNRNHKNYVTEIDIEQIKQEIIHGVNAFRIDKFDSLISSGDNSPTVIKESDVENVLRQIAINCQNDLCSRSNIDIIAETPIDEILEALVERNVLEQKKNNYYDIKVKLFKEWLIEHQ
jgi:tetratricopeptide (TPR) repeat protein